jgi:hypothetical protein
MYQQAEQPCSSHSCPFLAHQCYTPEIIYLSALSPIFVSLPIIPKLQLEVEGIKDIHALNGHSSCYSKPTIPKRMMLLPGCENWIFISHDLASHITD